MPKESTKKKINKKVPQAVLDFYLNDKTYTEVYLVTCLECGHDLMIWALDPSKAAAIVRRESHPKGYMRILLDSNRLTGHRIRFDREIGYNCVCGNSNIITEFERGIVPQGDREETVNMTMPHHKMLAEQRAKDQGYKPDIEEKDDGKTRIIDGKFKVVRVK